MKQYEVEVDMFGDCEISEYNSEIEAMAGAQAISLFAEETRVYNGRDNIIARFVKGEKHIFSNKRSYKHSNIEPDCADAIDPDVYGVLNLGPYGDKKIKE
jgi:hypothetical protein